MREAIRQLAVGCVINGEPFAKITSQEKEQIQNVLKEMKEKCQKHGF